VALTRLSQNVLRGNRFDHEPISIRRRSGGVVELEVSASPLYSDFGELTGSVAIVTDVTARKQTQRDLQELNGELERRVAERTAELVAANRELEAFCFSVSHDLRAPLRAVDGFTRAILNECEHVLPASGKSHLSRVRSASRRMSELIDSLLSLSKLTRVEIRREWVALSQIAEEVASDLESTKPDHWVAFQIEADLRGYGDPRLLRLLLENLLGNAFKFSENIEDATIRFRQEGTEFLVEDNGAGFDMTYAHRLFQPFERLHSASDYPGNGIGLATAHRIVTRHGGTITAEGTVGQGATFRFTLPPGPKDGESSGLFDYEAE
jgi:signal transduction histidine kinase